VVKKSEYKTSNDRTIEVYRTVPIYMRRDFWGEEARVGEEVWLR